MRILIADSGATKTDWAYIQNGKPVFMKTSGLHPAYLDPGKVLSELKKTLAGTEPDLIIFYGAGCYSPETEEPVRMLLTNLFGTVVIEVYDDLTAVAHAYLDREEGIVGIVGTGSASGYFRNGKKQMQVPSLGYLLGDEGSAADIGKRILRMALRDEFSRDTLVYLKTKIKNLEYSEVVHKLYSAVRPSYFLARVSEVVLTGEYPEEISKLVDESFQSYVDTHLKRYDGFPLIPIILTGGVAGHQKERIGKILERNAVRNFRITEGVISALAERQKGLAS